MSTVSRRDRPRPPAAAYLALEGFLGRLYFDRPPAGVCVEIEVTGPDGVTTRWHIPRLRADAVVRFCEQAAFAVFVYETPDQPKG